MCWEPWGFLRAKGGGAGGSLSRSIHVARLSLYGKSIHCPVTVIFDAWRQPGNLRQTTHQTGVTVMYSSEGERADQVIQQLIRQHGNETAVVSSDLEVINVARAFGAFVIRSRSFSVGCKREASHEHLGDR